MNALYGQYKPGKDGQTLFYLNVYCYLCNIGESTRGRQDACIPMDTHERGFQNIALSILFSEESTDSEKDDAVEEQCPGQEYYDPYSVRMSLSSLECETKTST